MTDNPGSKHIVYQANGMGSQSMAMLILAARGEIQGVNYVFTADTGAENYCRWASGRLSDAKTFFADVISPYSEKAGIPAFFVRSRDKSGIPLPDLMQVVASSAASFVKGGVARGLHIPMYGSKGGRYVQSCTDKYKIRAMKQQARRLGATTATAALGIHKAEAYRRVKGPIVGKTSDGMFDLYQTLNGKKLLKWHTHFYPLVDLGMNRADCETLCREEGLDYIKHSECDFCPHKDLDKNRWKDAPTLVLVQIEAIERNFGGELFFTSTRKPFLETITELLRREETNLEDMEDVEQTGLSQDGGGDCPSGGYCFV